MSAIHDPNPTHAHAAMDMQAEMRHWRSSYPNRPFFRSGLQFERYVPTLQFGYDTFVPHQNANAAARGVLLCHHYKDSVAACDRIDWAEAEMIVTATWARLHQVQPGSREAT
ncbi:MAG TPA: hypothetical protein VET30_07890 [Pseudoxanthomonas sp.]|nr:hypothetical protein [Pseudoxanthomonas sp.]